MRSRFSHRQMQPKSIRDPFSNFFFLPAERARRAFKGPNDPRGDPTTIEISGLCFYPLVPDPAAIHARA
jgi:hypothetical protein